MVAFELIGALKEGIEGFFYSSAIFSLSYPYMDPNALILIYLVGYVILWWKKLWGTIIITIVSTLGIILSQAGDIRLHFMLTFMVGFLYFVDWYLERKRIH